jgi:hypothetical protein
VCVRCACACMSSPQRTPASPPPSAPAAPAAACLRGAQRFRTEFRTRRCWTAQTAKPKRDTTNNQPRSKTAPAPASRAPQRREAWRHCCYCCCWRRRR